MELFGGVGELAEEVYALVKLKVEAIKIEKETPSEPYHLAFCYSMLRKLSRSFAFFIQQLRPEVRDAVCVFYLILRALDTVEDDTSIPSEIKVPILQSFHRHIYDRNWHFTCGTKDFKVLMDKFHYVSTAFLELDESYKDAIEHIAKRMGAGMAIFLCKEVETIGDYDDYCHYVSGLVGSGLCKLFYVSGFEDLAPESLSNCMGLFLAKTAIIRDYFEDINEVPKPRKFWPREIWTKYADKLEDLKCEENSLKAVQCLNEMVTNALVHVEDCLRFMSVLKEFSIFRFCAIPQILSIGMLAIFYNNYEVFQGVLKMRLGLTAKVIQRTRTMSDVYGAFYEFSSMLKAKVDARDPNAALTLRRIEAIQKACISSGLINKRGYGLHTSRPRHTFMMIAILALLLTVLFSLLFMR